MERTIYIQLLGEGTVVYRPVPAAEIGQGVYKVKGAEIYDPDDEVWEFTPGTYVLVEERTLSDGAVLVAVDSVPKGNVPTC